MTLNNISANAVLHFASDLLGLEKPQLRPMHTSILTGQRWLDEVLSGHPDRCRRELGMSALEFALLWAELTVWGDLTDGRYVTAQEQLAIFVYWMELFNLRHAQLRNIIERIFGVSKRRFRVLVSRPKMGYHQQTLMVGAAAALHNFLRIHEGINDIDDDKYDIEGHPFLAGAGNNVIDEEDVFAVDAAEKTRADARRDRITQAMWAVYILDHPDLQ
ncbi:putative nuclease HARBI1 [Mycena venus]|uniref:Putative nuclease HARBI1 n=1 Tax=Mycena venus TaxID=2733690 RepID=A0A8H6X3N3_9AGAR|nr:putative nuclease HARBI1 [Mycena venus]